MAEPSEAPPPPRRRILLRLFLEYVRISLCVVGGGYAIIVAADEAFGKRLKWLREGELLDRLPVFQMIPGLIAGNSAAYVGLKMAGVAGVAVAMSAVALPSFVVILAVARGYDWLPMENPWLQGAFLGLRAALAGIVAGTAVKTWPRVMRGVYPYVALAACLVLVLWFRVNAAWTLVGGMLCGIALELARPRRGGAATPPGEGRPWRGLWPGVLLAGACAAAAPAIFATFAKFGLLCFGGGNVLVPVYFDEFVGPEAPLLQLPADEFNNLLAITQMTPGPISVNAATFFGYRLQGVLGSFVATTGLLAPSFFLMVLALRSLEKWRANPLVKGLLRGVAPATVALMVVAAKIFAEMSVFKAPLSVGSGLPDVRLFALALAAFSGWALWAGRLRIMQLVLLCAALGALALRP
ncbi:MAG: chromate transporter [Kiritimatiellae bacterium]|nr:chromate transporter [Kiritimatiellia bacterium]